jgi:hypothetical protein
MNSCFRTSGVVRGGHELDTGEPDCERAIVERQLAELGEVAQADPRERGGRRGAHGVVGIVKVPGQELDRVAVLDLAQPADRGAPDLGSGSPPAASRSADGPGVVCWGDAPCSRSRGRWLLALAERGVRIGIPEIADYGIANDGVERELVAVVAASRIRCGRYRDALEE